MKQTSWSNNKNPPKTSGDTNHEPLSIFLITVLEDHRGHAMLARSVLSTL